MLGKKFLYEGSCNKIFREQLIPRKINEFLLLKTDPENTIQNILRREIV